MAFVLKPVDFDPFAEDSVPGKKANVKLRPVDFDPFAEEPEQKTGDFIPGVKRGIDQTQAMGYGAAALAGSALGMGSLKQWGMEGYTRNIEEAGQNPKSQTFKDVYTGKAGIGGTIDWMQGTFGELIPSMVEAATGALIGTALSPGPGTAVGGFAGRTILKKSIEKLTKEAVESKIKKGIIKAGTREAVEAGIKKEVTKQALKKLGGKVGMAAAVLPMESGGNYAGLLEEKGIDAPGTALFFGALATSLEYAGGNSRLIDSLIDGVATGKGDLVKWIAKELITNVPAEALQEGGQEAFSILNTVANTDERFLTGENIEQIIESMGAGAVGGLGGAAAQVAMPGPSKDDRQDLLDPNKGFSGEDIGDTDTTEELGNEPLFPEHDNETEYNKWEQQIQAQREAQARVAQVPDPTDMAIQDLYTDNQRQMKNMETPPDYDIKQSQDLLAKNVDEFRRQKSIQASEAALQRRQQAMSDPGLYQTPAEQNAQTAMRGFESRPETHLPPNDNAVPIVQGARSTFIPVPGVQQDNEVKNTPFAGLAERLGGIEEPLGPKPAPESPIQIEPGMRSRPAPKEVPVFEHEVEPDKVNTDPSDAQKEAGNYKKDHIKIDGHQISIENPDGSTRKGKNKFGKEWESTMHGHYGYFKRTLGKDGDQVDVVVKPGTETSPKVFVVDQVDPDTGRFDEHKVMFGYSSKAEAEIAYLSNYEPGWQGLGETTEMDQAAFKDWLKDGKRTKKPAGKRIETVQQVEKKISEIKKKKETSFQDGDPVQWTDKKGKTHTGTLKKKVKTNWLITKENGKTALMPESKISLLGSKTKEPEAEGSIGKNTHGKKVYEDENGARSYEEMPGIAVSQNVSIIPGKGIRYDSPKALFKKAKIEFLTKEEYENFSSEYEKETEQLQKAADEKEKKSFETEVENTKSKPSVKDQLKAEWGKQAKERKYKEEMAAAAKKAKKSASKMMDAFKNINSILGERGSFSTDKMDEDIYEQIKEQLNLAWGHAQDAGNSIVEFVSIAMDALSHKATPYFNRWVDEEIPEDYNIENKELSDDTSRDTGRTQSNESGSDTDRESESGTGLAGASNLADGKPAGVDKTTVPDGQKASKTKTVESNTDSSPSKSNQKSRGETGNRSDRGNDLQPDSSSTDRASNNDRKRQTNTRRDQNKDTRVERQPASTELKPEDKNHIIQPDDVIFPSGPETKIQANIKAIRLLKKLEKDDRNPTPTEKKALAKYVGWGAFAQKVFNDKFTGSIGYEQYLYGGDKQKFETWRDKYGKKLHPKLNGLLTKEEWDSAAASTLNAHYTSKEVIENVWGLVERLGFKGGHILEPSAGVGHFFGLMPKGIAKNSSMHGVELDSITGRILEKLYPESHIQVKGFEKAKGLGNNSMDLVVSNFPFGNFSVLDKEYKEYSKWSIHNYFFGKSIDLVRPGGLIVGITSHFTLDAISNGHIRKALGEKADFIGAIRLPSTAFKKDAGTEVVTDIIVFRKKDGTEQVGERFRLSSETKVGKGSATINEYFIEHPEMIIGKNFLSGSMYGKDEYTVLPKPGDLSRQIVKAVEAFPENIVGEGKAEPLQETIYADDALKEGVLTNQDGKFYVVENGRLIAPKIINSKGKSVLAIDSKTREERALAYIELRDKTSEMINRMQDPNESDADIEAIRVELNDLYDQFVKKYNRINAVSNSFLRKIDNDFPILDALENEDITITDDGKQIKEYSKADILKKRTIFPFIEPTSADDINDALAISLVYKNKIDTDYIARLTGIDADIVRSEILEKEHAYINPDNGLLETPDQYLSGNVKKKLLKAQKQAKHDQAFKRNVKALEAVQPDDIDLDFIFFKMGSSWLPDSAIGDFIKHLVGFEVGVRQLKTEESNSWHISKKNKGDDSAKNTNTWGVEGATALSLVKDALNLKRTKIYRSEYDPVSGKAKAVHDKEQSIVAQKKQDEIQEEFRRWARGHKTWSSKLSEIYNREYNGLRSRQFPVPDIDRFPGANKEISLRPLQKKAVARCLQESTLLSYGVGTGKTFTFVSLAMEMRRLKTARKPMIVVQGSTVQQFAKAFKLLYPQSKVLIPNDSQRSAKNRKKLLSQVATGDWDAVVIPHSFFDGIADDPEREAALIQEQIEELEDAMRAAAEEEGKNAPTVKQMERAKKKKVARLEKLQDRRTDNTITFEQMGIDALLIDEAHAYKRSEFSTKMGNIKGIDSGASQRSSSLILKSNFIREKTNNKNIILATGTPISNTTAELWTMIRYVKPELLAEFNVSLFDDFAANFGDTSITTEETDTGDFKEVERFNKFANGPELITLFHTASDVVLTKDAGLNLPMVKGGKAESVVIPRSEELGSYIEELRAMRQRFENMTGKEKMANRHIPLVVFGRAKKAAIDLQLIDPKKYSDDPNSKLNKVSKNLFDVWKKTTTAKSTQVVFLDTYQDATKTFNAYHAIKNKLVEKGVPAKEVLVVSDARNDSQKEAMFQKIRTGEARIIIGSTFKLGVGVNMQDKLVAAHHVDVPLRPMDIEQRNGRIVREGNENKVVQIFNYGVKNTLDSVMYDQLIKKQKFIDQMLNGDIEGREFDDPLGEEQISFAEMNAAFAGNPLLFEKSDVTIKIKELEILEHAHIRSVSSAKRDIRGAEHKIEQYQQDLIEAEKLKDLAEKDFPENEPRRFELDGKEIAQKDFIKTINQVLEEQTSKIRKLFNGRTRKDIQNLVNEEAGRKTIQAKVNGYDITIEIKADNRLVLNLFNYDENKKLDVSLIANIADVITSITKNNQYFTHFSGGQFTRKFNDKLSSIKNNPAFYRKEIELLEKDIQSFKDVSTSRFEKAPELEMKRERLVEINKELENNTRPTEDKDDVQFSTSDDMAQSLGHGVTIEDIQNRFKDQDVFLSPDGSISIRLQNGRGLTVENVKEISNDEIRLAMKLGRMSKKGKVLGNYDRRKVKIKLNKDLASNFVLDHEIFHFLKAMGMIDKKESLALIGEMKRLMANGEHLTFKVSSIKEENEANVFAYVLASRKADRKTVLGRLIQKVMDFLDALWYIGRQSARKLAREVESGKVFQRPSKTMPVYEVTGKNSGVVKNGKPSEISDAKFPHVELRKTGEIQVPRGKIKSSGEIAGILSTLSDAAQEEVWGITTDKTGRILEVHKFSKGISGEASAHVNQFSGHLLKNKEAAKVYLVHNHPSGGVFPSNADKMVTEGIQASLKLAGIKVQGVVIADDHYVEFDERDVDIAEKIKPIKRGKIAPVSERRIVSRSPLKPYTIIGDDPLTQLMRFDGEEDGVLLADGGGQEIAFIPYEKGKTIRQAAIDILDKAAKHNATTAIIHTKTLDKTNRWKLYGRLANGLGSQGIRVLDLITEHPATGPMSLVEARKMYEENIEGMKALDSDEVLYMTTDDIISEKFKTTGNFFERMKESVNEDKPDFVDRTIAKTVDSLHFVKKRLGDDAYKMHRMLTGIKSASFAMFLEHGKMAWAGNALTVSERKKGVLPFLRSIGPDWQNLFYWIAAKRAEQLDAEGRENWLDKAARYAILEKTGERSEKGESWSSLNDKFQEFNKNILDIMEESGLIDPESRAVWESNVYIPFYRIMEDDITRQEFLSGPRKSKKHISAQIRKLKGGQAKIGDPLENILMNWMHGLDAAARNKARAKAFEVGQSVGIIEEVGKEELTKILGAQTITRYAVVKFGKTRARAILDDRKDADALVYDLMEQGKGHYTVEPRKETRVIFGSMKDYGILSFQKEGKSVYFKTEDSDLYEALAEIDTAAFNNLFMQLMGGAKRLLSYGATFGPAFRLRNMIRDTVHTAVVAKSFRPFIDTGIGFVKAMREDAEYIEYMASGFGFGSSYVHSDDPKTGAKFIKKILKNEGKGALRRIIDPLRPWENFFFRVWEKIGAASENAARLGLYRNLKEKGYSNFDAGFEGRDLMDFSMRGNAQTIQVLTRIVPFLNARVQGLYKLGRSSRENPKAFLLKAAILTGVSLALWSLFKDDDRYKDLEDWDKWTYYHFWLGDDHYRIPKPFEIGALFSSLPESVANVANGTEEGEYVWEWFKHTAYDVFNVDMPQLFKPIIEERFNVDTFRDRPVVPESLENLKPSEQYQPWTSDTMRMIGQQFYISPIKLQHYVTGYFSSIGSMVLAGTDIITRRAMGYPSRPDGGTNPFQLRVIDSNVPQTTKYISRFYDLYSEVEAANLTFLHYLKTGQVEKARDFLAEYKKVLSLKTPVYKIRQVLSEANRQAKIIQRDKKMSPKEKKQRLDNINKTKSKITRALFQKIRSMR